MRKWLAVAALGVVCLLSAPALASVGVGVGTGRITIREPIKAGKIYTLPPVTVFNTGTQTATYTMAVTLNAKQPQLKPDPAWFSFTPDKFTLRPHAAQTVIPTFHPPLVTRPGNYFAYLEAHPAETVRQGTTSIGVAAATKLSFNVTSSNIFLALWYRLAAIYSHFSPWSYLLTALLLIAIILVILKRRLRFELRITKM
jgi:hypothetical protein